MNSQPTFRHTYRLHFDIDGSRDDTGEDVLPDQIKTALQRKIELMEAEELWSHEVRKVRTSLILPRGSDQ